MDNKKYWFFGSKLNTALLLVLIALMVIAIRIMLRNEATYFPTTADNNSEEVQSNAPAPQIEGPNKADLISFSIAPGSKVHGVVNYTGVIKNNYFFEANIPVHVTNANKKHLLMTHGDATTDWMTEGPVSFAGSIDFTNLPKGPAYIEIHNDNPSGDESREKTIDIPVVIE